MQEHQASALRAVRRSLLRPSSLLEELSRCRSTRLRELSRCRSTRFQPSSLLRERLRCRSTRFQPSSLLRALLRCRSNRFQAGSFLEMLPGAGAHGLESCRGAGAPGFSLKELSALELWRCRRTLFQPSSILEELSRCRSTRFQPSSLFRELSRCRGARFQPSGCRGTEERGSFFVFSSIC